jgi:methylthioribose-1-phosphate isomerase
MEVLGIQVMGQQVTPEHAKARNPAFDVTPHQLLTGLITECGVISPPFSLNLARILRNNEREPKL